MSGAFWTAEKTERLQALFAQGLSFSLISQAMGDATRSSVAGKIDRLQTQRARTVTRLKRRVPRTIITTPCESLNISLLDLKPRQCRYPYGDGPFFFCGHVTEESRSYCGFHDNLCHEAPWRERQRSAA